MDGLRGTAFYDDDAVFATYMATRTNWPDNPNDTRVVKVHRTIETYVAAMQRAGFIVDS